MKHSLSLMQYRFAVIYETLSNNVSAAEYLWTFGSGHFVTWGIQTRDPDLSLNLKRDQKSDTAVIIIATRKRI